MSNILISGFSVKCVIPAILLVILSIVLTTTPRFSASASTGNITSPRIGTVTLDLRHEDGTAWSDAYIGYSQITNDFLFGVGMTGPGGKLPYSLYPDFHNMGINLLMPILSWYMTEPQHHEFDWTYLDSFGLPSLRQSGFSLHGHLLIFFLDQFWCIPEYVKAMSHDELIAEIDPHVFGVVNKYRGLMTYWTINEPSDVYSDYFHLSQSEWIEIVRVAGQAIKRADPEAKVLINLVSDEHLEYSPLRFLDALVEQNVDFNVIGLEMYPGTVVSDANGYPDIEASRQRIESFAKYGKPIIITEIAVSESPSQEAQAVWMRSFYEMAFEIPQVIGIDWYYVVDDPGFPPSATAGLFPDIDSPPRLIYHTLADIIQERKTYGQVRTDSNGIARIDGYGGEYQLEVDDGTQKASFSIHIYENQDNLITLMEPATPTSPSAEPTNSSVTTTVFETILAPESSIQTQSTTSAETRKNSFNNSAVLFALITTAGIVFVSVSLYIWKKHQARK